MRRVRVSALGLLLLPILVFAGSACGGGAGRPSGDFGPGPGGRVGSPPAGGISHVSFEVTCTHCRMQWTYPGGRGGREVSGPARESVRYWHGASGGTISLDLTPLEPGTEIQAARILVNGIVRAEHRGVPGESTVRVHLQVDANEYGGTPELAAISRPE